jgi:hypothetical protein
MCIRRYKYINIYIYIYKYINIYIYIYICVDTYICYLCQEGGEDEEDADKSTRMAMRIQHDLAKMAGIKCSQF